MFIEVTINSRKDRLINCDHIVNITEENTQARLWFVDGVNILIDNTHQEIKNRLIKANLFLLY